MNLRIGAALTFVATLFTSASFGAQTVSIEVLNPPSDNIAAGYYIGPYQALVNGVPTNVICDDFSADTPMNAPWDATVMSIADLTDPLIAGQVRWSSSTVATYQQAAWLALQLNASSPSVPCFVSSGNCGADLQFAIWSLFDPSAYAQYIAAGPSSIPGANQQAIDYWHTLASTHYGDAGVNYASVLIYTPDQIEGGPQEFLSVRAPEPSSLLLLALNALGIVGLVWLARKPTAQN
jgi:hypothetical protein